MFDIDAVNGISHASSVKHTGINEIYSSPNRHIHDNGSKFLGHKFCDLLNQNSITIMAVPTTVKNLQSNAIYKHMHQMVANVLRITM